MWELLIRLDQDGLFMSFSYDRYFAFYFSSLSELMTFNECQFICVVTLHVGTTHSLGPRRSSYIVKSSYDRFSVL